MVVVNTCLNIRFIRWFYPCIVVFCTSFGRLNQVIPANVVKNTTILQESSSIAGKKAKLLHILHHLELSRKKSRKLLHVVQLAFQLVLLLFLLLLSYSPTYTSSKTPIIPTLPSLLLLPNFQHFHQLHTFTTSTTSSLPTIPTLSLLPTL
jgi:membrane-associated HD superfamily phosphohydrolase